MPDSDDPTGDAAQEDKGTPAEQVQAASHAPMTEEQMRASQVGELAPLNGPIQLVDYDPAWPHLFEQQAERVRAAWATRRCCWNTSARPPCRGWLPSRESTCCWWLPTQPTSQPMSLPWRRLAMSCASESQTGTNTACSIGQTRRSTCMFSQRGVWKSTACCSSATGCAATPMIGNFMNAPSAIWPARTGSTPKTTPTPRRQWLRRLWRGRRSILDKKPASKARMPLEAAESANLCCWRSPQQYRFNLNAV